MVKIDAHHHLWQYKPASHAWIDDTMSILKNDFLPQQLMDEMQELAYSGTVAVQASQTEIETDFLLKEAEKFSFIKGVVGWLDLRDKEIEEKITLYSRHKKLKGLRHVLQDEPDDRFMLREDFLRGISLLSKFNLTYDILIFLRHLEIAVDFVKLFPEQRFVLDHIGKPDIKSREISQWQRGIERLATHQNVYCKLSGMVTEADWTSWRYEDFVPYLDAIFHAFGDGRLMIGSDWPVCTLAGRYSQVMNVAERYVSQYDKTVQKKIMGQNAIDFYNLKI